VKLIAQIGEALYGDGWVSALARDLGINRKTIQRYASGEYEVNPNLYAELQMLLNNRASQIQQVQAELNKLTQEYGNRAMKFQNNELTVEIPNAAEIKIDGSNIDSAIVTPVVDNGFKLVSVKAKYKESQNNFVLEVLFNALNKNGDSILKTSIFHLNKEFTDEEVWGAVDSIPVNIADENSPEKLIIRVYVINDTTVLPNGKDFKRALDKVVPSCLSDDSKGHQSLIFIMALRGSLLRIFGKEMDIAGYDTSNQISNLK